MKILGIDEAGRGCVIGPLVMCGFEVDEDDAIFEQVKSQLKDSKQLSKKRRERLHDFLTNKIKAKVIMQIVHPAELNRQMDDISLNDIEEKCALDIVSSSNADGVYIDCFSAKKNFREDFIKKANTDKKFFIEFKADSTYKIVSAASIVAKVTRDSYIEKINEKYSKMGFVVGSGYPADKITILFLKHYFEKFKKMPEEVRTKWKTVQNIKQKNIFDF